MSTMAKVAKKHVVPPATAEEIRRAVGVTKEDARLVKKVMTELGYLPKPSPPRSAMAPSLRAGKQVPIEGDPAKTTGPSKARSK
jgi:hypothetical protein